MPRRRRALGSHESDELLMYIDNDASLYRQKGAARTSLTRHVCRGAFDKARAAKGFAYLTDAAGRKYAREFGMTRYPLAARREANADLVKDYLRDLRACLRQGQCGDLPTEAAALLRKSTCKPGGTLDGASRRRRRR